MKNYICYIKSHCEAPDYERETEAKNFNEAVKNLTPKHSPVPVEDDFIADNTWCPEYAELCPDCKSPIEYHRELREDNYYEMIGECKGCGLTITD